jgi:RimJ/RimL family protein N-acetyltransferase
VTKLHIIELDPSEFNRVRMLFAPMDYHLTLASVFSGVTPARVYVDNATHPHAALVWAGHRIHLAGSPDDANFNTAIGGLFTESIYTQEHSANSVMFILYYAEQCWDAVIEEILRLKYPIKTQRQCYVFTLDQAPNVDWRTRLPPDFRLAAVNDDLMVQTHLKNLPNLQDEMCSERHSVRDFLEKSFGVCMIHGDELAGWCLSEYNTDHRCEVGIETPAHYQRRGLGMIMTCALVELAHSYGVTSVGWHCWASNIASSATALKAGFTKLCDYPAYFAWYDEVDNLAMHGNLCLNQQQYTDAIQWYELAMSRGEVKGWGYLNAACAAAELGLYTKACLYLEQALAMGAGDLVTLQNSSHFKTLRGTVKWETLISII